ncbi:MAG: T9SS type A sorting domain-containing protein [Chitinophagales bacterium]|nr:T9SS type A sorting domain-containing protein [Chitinophagales bacterium]
MKALVQSRKFLFILSMYIFTQQAQATHSAGGYITYRCIDTAIGRYEILAHLFRDCSGVDFGIDNLTVISSTLNTTIPVTRISAKEVTPFCQVPDVPTRSVSNCPNGPITGIRGIEKAIFRGFVTLGKNKGWAIIGWYICCRQTVISNIQAPSAQTFWVQAAINTNVANSSPIFNSEATNYLWKGKENWLDLSVRDSFDPKYILINGNYVVLDSFAYEFYNPNTSIATNVNQAANLQNPAVTFNSGLSASQFMPSNPAILLNKTAGIAKINPTIEGEYAAAMVIKEYRAIPTANGKSYTRMLVGHICRDQVFSTMLNGTSLTSHGVISDSSNVEYVVNPNLVRTCRAKGNKIMMRFSTSNTTGLKLKDVSVINQAEIENYKFRSYVNTVNGVTTGFVEFKFDRNFATLGYEFKVKVYYCNSLGISVENYVPLSVQFSNATIGFEQDTLLYCNNSGTTSLSLPLAKKVSWKSNNAIVSSNSSDSNLVHIMPLNSHWIYATNLKHDELCRVNDSIYVKLETCNQVKGNIYHDVNNNCANEANIDVPAKLPLNLKGKTNGYNQTIYPDNNGNYSFSPPAFNNYTLTVNNVVVNCNPKVNVFDVSLADSPVIVSIAVKDSPSFVGYPSTPQTLNYCVGEAANVEFVLPFVKSMGYVKAKMDYGNGQFEERILGIEPMQTHLVFNKTYNTNGVFPASIKILSYDDKILYQTPMNTISIGSCLHAKFYIDMNDNCNLDTGDMAMSGSSIVLTDISTNQKQNSSTNTDGIVSYYVKNGAQYNLSNANVIGCNQDKQDITFNLPNIDTNYHLNVPLDRKKIIPTIESSIQILNNKIEHCINSPRSFAITVTKSLGYLSMKLICNDGKEFLQALPFGEGVYTYNYSHTFLNKTIGNVNAQFFNFSNKIYEFSSNDFIQIYCLDQAAFNDISKNCSDEIEPRMKYTRFKLTNLVTNKFSYLTTNHQGKLRFYLTYGDNYRIESLKFPICNSLYSIDFLADSNMINNFIIPVQFINNYAAILSTEGRAVVNNTSDYLLNLDAIPDINNVQNDFESNTFIYELTLPDKCLYKSVNSGITMTALGGNKYLFEGSRKIKLKVTVEFRNLVATDDLCFSLRLRGIPGERDTIDNHYRVCRRAFVAYDPNNKIPAIRSSINTEDFIDKTNPITYTINFQNEGKAPARDVYILDQLSKRLNIESIEVKAASHPMSVSLTNDGLLRFDFKDIILPEKAVDEEGSKGYVIFTIKPKDDLQIGEEIRNTAEIYFDANEAVITNTAISRLVKPTGSYDFFNVNITTHPENAGITRGQGRYLFDDPVKVDAIPREGYQFKYWTDNGVIVGPNSNYYFTSNKNRNLTAYFTKSTSQVLDVNSKMSITPNPATDFVNIETNQPLSKFSVSITSIDGRKLAQFFDQTKISVESLPRGTYFLELRAGDIVKVEKLILR